MYYFNITQFVVYIKPYLSEFKKITATYNNILLL
jgi:hypothetical protein